MAFSTEIAAPHKAPYPRSGRSRIQNHHRKFRPVPSTNHTQSPPGAFHPPPLTNGSRPDGQFPGFGNAALAAAEIATKWLSRFSNGRPFDVRRSLRTSRRSSAADSGDARRHQRQRRYLWWLDHVANGYRRFDSGKRKWLSGVP
jgi:hypothetical protein